MTAEPTDEDLRLVYLDWCSTQVAKRFLELSHDEVWLRSHFAETLPAGTSTEPHAPGRPEPVPGYLELVRRTAVLLAQEMELPPFAEWKRRYEETPDAFRADLMRGAGPKKNADDS